MSAVLDDWNLSSNGIEPSEGLGKIEDLIETGNPGVVVFDLDPPYSRSSRIAWQLVDRFPDRSFVLTCADPVLAVKSAPWLSRHPIFQKPYETNKLAGTIRSLAIRALRSLAMVAR
jgi:hypothetical protein